MNSYDKLYESFKKNYESDEDAKENWEFFTAFVKVAKKLAKLEIDDCFVDVGRNKRMMDFNLNLPHKVFLSACRFLDDEDEDDMFYVVGRNGKTLSVGIIQLDELVSNMEEIEAEFTEMDRYGTVVPNEN